MNSLPIVIRELRVAARRSATYNNRVIVAGVVGGLAIGMLLYGSLGMAPSRVGATTFQIITSITLIFSLLAGVRKTADSLSEEKREGTLGLLFLTDLKGYDVILGKFTALSLGSIHGLLSLMPVMAVSFLLGGVTKGEFWRMVLALSNIQFFSLCAGVAVSSFGRLRYRTIGGTILLITAIIGLPYLGGATAWRSLSPIHAYFTASDVRYATDASQYWWSIEIAQFLSWTLLACASLMAPRLWHDQPGGPSSQKWEVRFNLWRFGNPASRAARRTRMLEINPVFWLAGRNLGHRRVLWIFGGIGAGVAGLFVINARVSFLPAYLGLIRPIVFVLGLGGFSQAWIALVWLLNLILKIRLASQACHCLAEARRNQAIEMLLTTPLTVEELISGQIRALQDSFMFPFVAIFGLEMLGGLIGSANIGAKTHSNATPFLIRGMSVIYFFMFLLDAVAVTWAGMWFGLSSRKENEAAVKTIFFVLIFPLVCMFFWPIGAIFMIGTPVFWIIYSRYRLFRHLRNVAIQRHGHDAQQKPWLPEAKSPALATAEA